MSERLVLKDPYDMHIHFREGEMLELVAPLSATTFSGGIIMPNLIPPVDSLDRLGNYIDDINKAIGGRSFHPFMTIFFKKYDRSFLESVKSKIKAIKLYPAGATTNSDEGLKQIEDAFETLEIMQDMGIPLLVHGETHGFVMDREQEFLEIYKHLATAFPKLMIVMEHITTAGAVELLDKYSNLYATVTLQHLCITLDDVIGGLMQPHNFCKPIAKRPKDMHALLEVAISAHHKLSFGSDSAPHPVDKKEAAYCSAGCFTAPFALQYLADIFESNGALDNLQKFVSDNAVKNYNLQPIGKTVVLQKGNFTIPEKYGNVVPFDAGKKLHWTISEINQ
jgi:dihydroorotase